MSAELTKVEYIKAFLQTKDTITIGCDSGPEGTDKGQHRVRVDAHMPDLDKRLYVNHGPMGIALTLAQKHTDQARKFF